MHSEIYRIAYKLHTDGKTPSVALIRARLSTPTPLPVIIKALQQWKLTPELGKEAAEDGNESSNESGNESINGHCDSEKTAVEQRLDAIEQKLDRILAILDK